MTFLQSVNKHIEQIKKGRIFVVIKKLRSLIYLILQTPIYLISIPAVIIIRLIRPWFLIRWDELPSSRIGHFVPETELYCCERDAGINTPSQRYLDVFYLRKYVSNKQVEKMWQRELTILPRWLLVPLFMVNRFLNIFVSGGNYHEINDNTKTRSSERDVNNLLEKFKPHMNFTHQEEIEGKKMLAKFGVPKNAKFVCLIVRDSAYLDRYKEFTLHNWNYHNYRDGHIDKYVLAAEELARKGYYIFRTGIKVLKPLKSSDPKIIDYSNSGMRSDFMDIYLGAKCTFCISTHTGLDCVPFVFRKPIAYILVPFAFLITNNENNLMITKHHINKKNQKELTVSEIFSSNVAMALKTKIYEINNIELKENSPEEIKDLVIEMDERLNGGWNETEEDLLLQKKFWSIFEENINKLKLKKPLHGKIKARFGSKFLRDNKDWII